MNIEEAERRIEDLEHEIRGLRRDMSELAGMVANLAEEAIQTNRKLLQLTGEDK